MMCPTTCQSVCQWGQCPGRRVGGPAWQSSPASCRGSSCPGRGWWRQLTGCWAHYLSRNRSTAWTVMAMGRSHVTRHTSHVTCHTSLRPEWDGKCNSVDLSVWLVSVWSWPDSRHVHSHITTLLWLTTAFYGEFSLLKEKNYPNKGVRLRVRLWRLLLTCCRSMIPRPITRNVWSFQNKYSGLSRTAPAQSQKCFLLENYRIILLQIRHNM